MSSIRLLIVLTGALSFAAERQVAITIDDLPRGGDGGGRDLRSVSAMTVKLMKPFRQRKIPVTGFVNAGRAEELGSGGLRKILDLWLEAGADLGNHTYSHPQINRVPLEEYTADVTRGEAAIREALAARSRKLRYFRHPYLLTGPTPEIKMDLQKFLDVQGYQVAPVTIDDADYLFAAAYNKAAWKERVRREYVPYMEAVTEFFEKRSVEVLGREIPQILLIHASQMNADLMPELLAMFKRRGYRIISLEEALKDEAYRQPEDYVGRNGISWIHRWAKTKGMAEKWEPNEPKWVNGAR